jgi:hypothetical protein
MAMQALRPRWLWLLVMQQLWVWQLVAVSICSMFALLGVLT